MTRFPRILSAALALACCLTAATAQAQSTPPPTADDTRDGNLNAYVELLRSDLRTQKSAVIAQVMGFTPAEDTAFWPIYRDYEAKLAKINDDRLALTLEYAAKYHHLTEADADRMMKSALDVQSRRNALTADYYDQLKKGLSPMTAVRVIQVEHQILLLLDLQIAASLPIVE